MFIHTTHGNSSLPIYAKYVEQLVEFIRQLKVQWFRSSFALQLYPRSSTVKTIRMDFRRNRFKRMANVEKWKTSFHGPKSRIFPFENIHAQSIAQYWPCQAHRKSYSKCQMISRKSMKSPNLQPLLKCWTNRKKLVSKPLSS